MMRIATIAIALSLSATAALAQDAWRAHSAEIAAADPAVRAPLEAYMRGHATGDPAEFRAAFHDDALVWGSREGALIRWTDDDYIGRAGSGQPAADEAQRRRWIERLDVAGDTATARIILDYPSVRFTDDMQLVRVDGRWLIVSKMFLAEPKAPPAT